MFISTGFSSTSGVTKKFGNSRKNKKNVKNGPLVYCYTKYNPITKGHKLLWGLPQRGGCRPSVTSLPLSSTVPLPTNFYYYMYNYIWILYLPYFDSAQCSFIAVWGQYNLLFHVYHWKNHCYSSSVIFSRFLQYCYSKIIHKRPLAASNKNAAIAVLFWNCLSMWNNYMII